MIFQTITYSCDVCHTTIIKAQEVGTADEITIHPLEGWETVDYYLDDTVIFGGRINDRLWEDKYICPECQKKNAENWKKREGLIRELMREE